ncbi:hypothetical protein [Candidatus Amoebophilus asiaticus]|nr:hypothetical protein [Candidatus Amoebophilus asiaticus]
MKIFIYLATMDIELGIEKDDFVFPILNKNEHTTPQQISNGINRILRQK